MILMFVLRVTGHDKQEVATPVISSAVGCGEEVCNTMKTRFKSPVKIVLTSGIDVSESL